MKDFLVIGVLALACSISYSQNLLTQQASDRLFESGLNLLDHRQYGAAREAFSEYIDQAPAADNKRAEATYYKAVCSLNLFHSDAERQVDDFMKEYPNHPRAVTANYDLANFYYNEKNYKKASVYYGKIQFRSLGQEQQRMARFRWGYSYFNQRQLKESLEQFSYVKGLGGEYGPAASYYAGFVEYSQGDYTNALIDLKRAEQNEAYAKVVPYLIANVYYRQKNYDELLKYAQQVEKIEGLSNAEEIALLTAEAYYKKRDYANALIGYKKYLDGRESKADKGVLLRAGYAAYTLGDEVSAMTFLKSSFTDTDSVGYYSAYYLGALYLKQNQKPMAQNAFDVARKYLPDQKLVEESTFQYAKVSYDLGMPDQAITELEGLLKEYPTSSHKDEIRELLSQAYVNASNYNKAIEYIEAMPKRGPSVDRAYQKATLLKGIELYNKEQYPEAVQYFEKSLQFPLDPQYVAEASFWCGETFSLGRKLDQAATQYQRIIGLTGYSNPDLTLKARYGLGYVYYNQQQYDRALFNFKEFVNKAPRNQPNLADGLLRLADCYYVSKSYPDALINYRKVAQFKSPDEDYSHLQAGTILGILSKYDEANTELEMVIKNFPNSGYVDEAIFQRAQLNFEQGLYAAAVAGYANLIQTHTASPLLPYAYTRRAASNYNLKEYSKTAQDYITVLQNYGGHPASNDILIPLQEALTLSGRSAEFDQYMAQYKAAYPDAKGVELVEFESAKNLYFNQDYTRAVTALTNYTVSYPESPRVTEANYYKAEAYYRLKDFDKALALYEQIAPDNTFSFNSKVIGRLAELEFKKGKYEKAIPYFRQLSKLATNKKDQFTAWNGLMESFYLLAQYDSVGGYARLILEKGNVNAGAQNKAMLYLGKVAMAKGDYELAQDEFISTLNAARDEHGAEAKYRLGEIQYLTKAHKACYETLVSLNSDFAAYPEWVGKSFLLLADNYLAMGDGFQAKATLKSLDAFPQENIRLLAQEKLKKIEGDEVKKTNEAKADTLQN